MTKPESKPPRTKKTPARRAQEALDVADRIVDRLTKQRDTLRRGALAAEGALTDATKRRNYLAQNPDLPQTPTKPTTDKEPTE